MSLSRLSVSARFLLVLGIAFSFQAGISVVSLIDLRNSLMQDRTAEVKHLLEVGYTIASYYHDQANKGLLTDEQAQKAAIDALRAMRYDEKNYYCVWDLHGKGVAHGGRPELEGRTFLDSPDAEKNPVVASMVKTLLDVAQSPAREGIASYRIPKAGQSVPLEKISYTRLFEPWGWSISTGTYIDDIDAALHARALWALGVFLAMIGLASAITFLIGRDLSRAMNRLANRVTSVARGELEGDVPDIGRKDEVGVMARALLVLRDTSREAAELRLDQLTGLPTRKLLMDQLRRARARSARNGKYGALMLIDMDRFKTLNDTHGHDAGDALLREVARRLTAHMREGDTVARLGGDEFVVVLVDVARQETEAAKTAESVGKKLLAVLRQPYHLGDITHSSAASIGVTLFQAEGPSDEDLLKQADLAMYRAKELGRNVCGFFDPALQASVQERATLEKELRAAVSQGQFRLHFQPQIGRDGNILGAEALVRWEHPLRSQVLPSEFISLAEETGLILPLGEWILETACQQLATWGKNEATRELRVAVNVSARQFQQPGFVDGVLAALQRTGADPQRLTLELTESVLVHNIEDVIHKMSQLKGHGVRFALDDFGTGYSSLLYIKRLPLDQLKIDRTFVRDVLDNADDAAIANMIVALARTLGLEVLAEGIETERQRDFLERAGCNSYQGYHFSRPLPLPVFEGYLAARAAIAAAAEA